MKLPDPYCEIADVGGFHWVYSHAQLLQAIRDAREECAKVCQGRSDGACECAEAIRALKEPT